MDYSVSLPKQKANPLRFRGKRAVENSKIIDFITSEIINRVKKYVLGRGCLVQQLRCCLGCPHPILECVVSRPSSASYSSFLLMQTLGGSRWDLPPMWETWTTFSASAFGPVQLRLLRQLGSETADECSVCSVL